MFQPAEAHFNTVTPRTTAHIIHSITAQPSKNLKHTAKRNNQLYLLPFITAEVVHFFTPAPMPALCYLMYSL